MENNNEFIGRQFPGTGCHFPHGSVPMFLFPYPAAWHTGSGTHRWRRQAI